MPKIKFLTTASDLGRCAQLERSLKRFDYDYKIVQHGWSGFGSKLIATRNALDALKAEGYTHFLYGDSYDSFVLGPMSEVYGKVKRWDAIIHSTEKANYPHPSKVYPEVGIDHAWRYLNGGGFFAPIDLYIQMFDSNPCPPQLNDQEYQVDAYLNDKTGLDTLELVPEIFQTYSFINEGTPGGNDGDFAYVNGRLINMVCNTTPILIHGNGKTPLDRIYNLIP